MNQIRTINSEPVLFLFSVSLGLYVTIYQAFIKYKVCLPLASPEICRHLKNGTDKGLADIVNSEAAHYSIYLQICSGLPAFFVSFFIGAWSDANGRKTPLALAMGGITLNGILLIFVASFPWFPLWSMLLGATVCGLTGQLIIVFSSCFSMISDAVKDPTTLTLRVALGSSLIYLGIVCGSLISSLISAEELSYEYVFVACATFTALGFFYTVFFTRETLHLNKLPTDMQINENTEESAYDKMCLCQKLLHFFHLERVKEAVQVLIRPRAGRTRCHLNLGIFAFLVIFSCDIGIPGLQYLFVTSKPLYFTDEMYSVLVAVQTACSAVGMIVLSLLMKKVFHLNDMWLIIVAFLLSIAKSLTFAFSTKLWTVFLSATCNFGATLYFPGFRAYLSKLVERTETARLYAVISSVEHVAPILSGVIFNNIYAATLEFFSGFVWVLGAGITGAMLILICWLQYDSYSDNIVRVACDDDQAPILSDDLPTN